MSVATITPNELDSLRKGGRPIDLIDVRTPAEFAQVHVEDARLIPLGSLKPKSIMAEREGKGPADDPFYLICRSGARSRQAAEQFAAAGYANAVNVEGGMLAWERDGLAVVRGKKTMSLERQVRIAAGSLVVLGTVLGAFVHPLFLGLAGFVGAGLVFAGSTDTCGMGMLLARMPWNRAGGQNS